MEDKKNGKTMPVAINIGAGSGIGGIVLLGGSLVTATVVSALRRRRSSSESISKSPSFSPETQIVDASNQLESLPLNLQKPSRDEETNMEEIQIKNIQDLTLDEKDNSGNDIAEQEKTSICEEQVVMAANIESAPPSSDDDSEIIDRDDDGEEQKNSMLIDDKDDKHVDTKLSVSNESVTSIEEHEAADVRVRVEQSMDTDITPETEQSQEPIQDDKTAIEDDRIAIEKEDTPQLQFPEKESIQGEIKDSVDDEDEKTVKEDNQPTQLMNKEEHKDTEEIIPDVKSIEEDRKKDGTSKTELTSSDESEDSSDEEPSQEGKTSKQKKSQEGMEGNQTSVRRKKRRSSITGKLKDTWRKIKVF